MKRMIVMCALFLVAAACGPTDAAPSTSTTISPPTFGSSTTTPSTVAPAHLATTIPEPPSMVAGDQLTNHDLWALVDGNDIEADRINLVFAPWGWPDHEAFVDYAFGAISWNGDAYLITPDGFLTDAPFLAWTAELGVFAVEPWRSATDRFNVWYTDVEPEIPGGWLNNREADPFGLPDQTIVILGLDARSFNPDLISVAGQDLSFSGPGMPLRPDPGTTFANSLVVIEPDYRAGAIPAIAHELGHAMFGLPDEYVGEKLGFDGRPNLSSWPSCAEDADEADVWWGDLLGSVDPMLEVWIEEMAEAGFPVQDPGSYRELIRVDHVELGCYDVEGSVRATRDSMMNNNLPMLGSVNRRWAERILALWSGAPR